MDGRARGKRKGPGAAARHSQSLAARVNTVTVTDFRETTSPPQKFGLSSYKKKRKEKEKEYWKKTSD